MANKNRVRLYSGKKKYPRREGTKKKAGKLGRNLFGWRKKRKKGCRKVRDTVFSGDDIWVTWKILKEEKVMGIQQVCCWGGGIKWK